MVHPLHCCTEGSSGVLSSPGSTRQGMASLRWMQTSSGQNIHGQAQQSTSPERHVALYADGAAAAPQSCALKDLVIAEGSVCNLQPGMPVQFRVFKPQDRPVAAAEVTSIGGQPL
eukprot:3256677-Amphidinium_carterae.1